MQLARYAALGRDNNFNLMRMIAAMMVLFSHSYMFATGSASNEPWRSMIGMTPGSIAVDIFFITSGYLVTRSIIYRKNIYEFIVNRSLRIYPGLIVSVVVTIVAIGLFFQPDRLIDFITSSSAINFVMKNCTLLSGIAFTIPGVFDDAPYKSTINGSLWTLPYELSMYASLAIVWIASFAWREKQSRLFAINCISVLLAASVFYYLKFGLIFKEFQILRLMFLFYSGSVYWVFSEKIMITNRAAAFSALIMIASSFFGFKIFFAAYMLSMPYLVMYLAHIPAGYIRKYNSIGDYSYGVYVYSFPVQQAVSIAINPISPSEMFIISFIITTAFAIVSWKIVEHPALQVKGKLSHHFRQSWTVQS